MGPSQHIEYGGAGIDSGPAQPVREMFTAIASRYDLLNSVLSLGLDRVWRSEAALAALKHGAIDVLDAATGTGELALTLKRLRPETRVVGVDFSSAMLAIAAQKVRRRAREVDLLVADVLSLPFEDESFDAVTIGYGLRNLTDVDAGLAEMIRVLRPGGRLVILEFPPPPDNLFGRAFRNYFLHVLPRIGGWISGSRSAYSYLPTSVLAFPRPPELAARLHRAGFTGVRYRLQSFGVSAIHIGEKE